MKKSREDWKREVYDLRRNLKVVRDMLQEGRVGEAITAADVAIGPNTERVEMPPSTEPESTRYFEGYNVCAWSPHPVPGTIPATQIHFILNMAGLPPMALRFKSPRAVDNLVSLLGQYRGEVWGGRPS
jgi:hypothetical protein